MEIIFMNMNKLILIFSIMLILTITSGAVTASEVSNETIIENSNYLNENIDENILQTSDYMDETASDDSSMSKTFIIEADKENPNQVLNPTVQPVIDNNASDEDTIILDGNFVHCHFTINKRLNVISNSGTSLDACPHHKHKGVSEFGVFYITEGGSGSVIEGFTFHNNDRAETPFAILIRGASNVTIKDCTMNFYNPNIDRCTGIIIENSNNVNLINLDVSKTIYGIRIRDSSNVTLTDCLISDNVNYGISITGNSRNINIENNTIINNALSAVNLSCADNVRITNNCIMDNGNEDDETGCGIYVNCEIKNLTVRGNIFISNGAHAILYDYRCRNLNNENGAELFSVVDNNYFAGHKSMILHHRIYIPHEKGDHNYDSKNDTFIYVGEGNGQYLESKSYVYMRNAFIVSGDIVCGFTYYTPEIPWTLNAPGNDGKYDFSLKLSNISQLNKGVYQVSIVDSKGNTAEDLSSFNVSFYLNNYSTVKPNENETCKTVKIENGVATADLRDLKDKYMKTGNVITASFPGNYEYVTSNPKAQFNVSDADIPGVLTATEIVFNNESIYYSSKNYITAYLIDENAKGIKSRTVTALINNSPLEAVSDDKGEIKIPVNLNAGNYPVSFIFNGDDDYANCSLTGSISILKSTPKMTAYSLTTYPLSDEYLKVKLTDNDGNAMKSQLIKFTVNGKTLSAKTDKNGIAKVKVSLSATKTYKATIKYAGSANYASISKTASIVVKTGAKKSKITASNIKVKKNAKKTFSLKLLSSNGKALSNQKVLVKINGKIYTLKTNSKGVAKLSVKFNAVKKYNAVIKFLGNKNYKSSSKTCTINVVKK